MKGKDIKRDAKSYKQCDVCGEYCEENIGEYSAGDMMFLCPLCNAKDPYLYEANKYVM